MKQIEQKSYKETTVTNIGNGTLVQSNNDIEFTDEIKLAIEIAAYLENRHNIDMLVDKFAR